MFLKIAGAKNIADLIHMCYSLGCFHRMYKKSSVYIVLHFQEFHSFDLLGIIEKENLDIYERVKVINYIRKENHNAKCFVCGKADLGSLQKLRQHYAESNHLLKGLPEKPIWCTEEFVVYSYLFCKNLCSYDIVCQYCFPLLINE